MNTEHAAIETLELPLGTLSAARLSKEAARLELAIMLYASRRLSFGKARQLAGLAHLPFRHALAARGITVALEPADIDADLEAIAAITTL